MNSSVVACGAGLILVVVNFFARFRCRRDEICGKIINLRAIKIPGYYKNSGLLEACYFNISTLQSNSVLINTRATLSPHRINWYA
jgi:hypothetical protein